jgi:nitrite reductase (NADH) small subunit
VAALEVAKLSSLAERTPTLVQVGTQEVVLVRDRESVYALRNVCPHMDVSLMGGAVISFAFGTPDNPCFDDERPVLTCPWHQYEFALATGECLTSGRLSARTYAVTVEDGRVFVDVGAHAEGARRRRGSVPRRVDEREPLGDRTVVRASVEG